MQIAFISPSFYPAFYYGGPIFSSYNSAKEFAKLGINVYVTTTNINGKEKLDIETNRFMKKEENLFIKYHSLATSNGFSPLMLIGLWKDISASDLVYTQSVFSTTTFFALLYSYLLKKPVLFSPRGQLGEWCLKSGSRFKKLWLKYFIRPFVYKINWHVTSKQEKKEVEALYPGVRINVIPNGIDSQEYKDVSQIKNKKYFRKYIPHIKETSKVIVSMGRLHSKKGFDILIDAFIKLREDNSDSFLLIAGEDYGEKKNLLDIIHNKGLTGNVFLAGQINDTIEKVSFLANADVFALASHNENFGIVYAEALAAGTPIVASKNTPWQEVENFQCGKWVENTASEFSKAIIDLYSRESKTLSINAKKLAAKYYWPHIALNFKDVFYKIINGSNEV